MQRRPLDHQGVRAARQTAVDDIQCHDVVLRFVLAINGMEMWRGMIVPVHPDEDPEEFADGGHVGDLRQTKRFQSRRELSLQKPRDGRPMNPK